MSSGTGSSRAGSPRKSLPSGRSPRSTRAPHDAVRRHGQHGRRRVPGRDRGR
jgi:hypothetical protein